MARKKLKHVYIVKYETKHNKVVAGIFKRRYDAICFMIRETDRDELTEEELEMTDDKCIEIVDKHHAFPLSNKLNGEYYFKLEKHRLW